MLRGPSEFFLPSGLLTVCPGQDEQSEKGLFFFNAAREESNDGLDGAHWSSPTGTLNRSGSRFQERVAYDERQRQTERHTGATHDWADRYAWWPLQRTAPPPCCPGVTLGGGGGFRGRGVCLNSAVGSEPRLDPWQAGRQTDGQTVANRVPFADTTNGWLGGYQSGSETGLIEPYVAMARTRGFSQ